MECIDQTKATYSLLFTCTECGLSWNIYQSKNYALDSRFVKNIRKNHEIMQVRSIGKNIIHAKFTPEPLPVEYVRKTTKLKTVQNNEKVEDLSYMYYYLALFLRFTVNIHDIMHNYFPETLPKSNVFLVISSLFSEHHTTQN